MVGATAPSEPIPHGRGCRGRAARGAGARIAGLWSHSGRKQRHAAARRQPRPLISSTAWQPGQQICQKLRRSSPAAKPPANLLRPLIMEALRMTDWHFVAIGEGNPPEPPASDHGWLRAQRMLDAYAGPQWIKATSDMSGPCLLPCLPVRKNRQATFLKLRRSQLVACRSLNACSHKSSRGVGSGTGATNGTSAATECDPLAVMCERGLHRSLSAPTAASQSCILTPSASWAAARKKAHGFGKGKGAGHRERTLEVA